MALYRIERPLDDIDEEVLDAAAYRARACLPLFQQMHWVRSYLDRQGRQMTCYYEAESAGDIRHHAEMARIPCATVTEVIEVLPERYG